MAVKAIPNADLPLQASRLKKSVLRVIVRWQSLEKEKRVTNVPTKRANIFLKKANKQAVKKDE